jgi:hypothetical protein
MNNFLTEANAAQKGLGRLFTKKLFGVYDMYVEQNVRSGRRQYTIHGVCNKNLRLTSLASNFMSSVL